MGRRWLCAVFLLLLLPLPLQAVTRQVAPGGPNSGGCTSTACGSINYCASQMAPGDVCEVAAGTYNEQLTSVPGGSPGSPITIKLKPGAAKGSAIVRPTTAHDEQIILLRPNRSDIVFDGLVLDGNNGDTGSGIEEDQAGAATMHRITFKNGEVRFIRKSGIIGGGDAWVIDNNYIHDVSYNSECCGTGSDEHGIYWQGRNSQITNNIFNNPRGCYNMQLHAGDNHDNVVKGNIFVGGLCGALAGDTGSNHHVVNNIFHHNQSYYADGCVICYFSNSVFYNNTLAHNSGTKIFGRGGNTYRNNIFCGNAPTSTPIEDSGSSVDGSNYIASTCPANTFASPGSSISADYRLQSGASAMINTVSCVSEASPDPDGVGRPVGSQCDRGAYEFGGAAIASVATALQFLRQPSTVAVNTAITPSVQVQILDQFGAPMPTASAAVTLTITTNPGGSTLPPGAGGPVTTAGGIATFPSVSLNFPANGYELTATSTPALTSATSLAFDVTGPSTACSSPCTVYVAPGGSDSQPCNAADIAHPRATLAGGVSCLTVAGSTLYLRGGTYPECLDTSVTPLTGGTDWLSPTTIAGYGSETVILAPTDPAALACQAVMIFRNAADDHYIRLDRLILDAGNRTDANGLVFYPGSHHMRFQNGVIRNTFYEGVFISNANDTEVLSSTIGPSQWYGINVVGSSTRTLLQDLTVTGHAQVGIQVTNGSIVTVQGVTLTGNGASGTVPAVRVGGSGNTGSLLANAVVYGNYGGIQVTSGASGLKLLNSTVANNTTFGIQLDSGVAGTVLSNVISTGHPAGQDLVNTPGLSTTQSAVLLANPGFVDAAAGDFRLLPTATSAIDAGVTLAEVPTDRVGTSRPQPAGGVYDIGAYEYPVTCEPPAVASGGVAQAAPDWKTRHLFGR